MKIVRIEPTPSPNVMKLTMDESLNAGVRINISKSNVEHAPAYLRQLLTIADVTGVFQTADFIALERHPKGDWPTILNAVQQLLPVCDHCQQTNYTLVNAPKEASFGEVTVRVQTFRGIPMQIRVSAGLEEKRDVVGERFTAAAVEAGLHAQNLIYERKLEEWGVRYGTLEEVLATIKQEIEASFDAQRLQAMAAQTKQEEMPQAAGQFDRIWTYPAWESRYAALQHVPLEEANIAVFARALKDEHVSIRRFAVVQLGSIEHEDVLPYIYQALYDPSPIVRRTAGDTCSDKADPSAMVHMVRLLHDRNKLVRWRAARFLYDMGGDNELEALHEAVEDAEFEVALQIRLAIERIETGGQAAGAVWQQMAKRNH
jgi:hypothetical protein